jgi:3-oxoacyl-[acyl-carrier-protein] synthase II
MGQGIAVTGLGLSCALGTTRERVLAALREGRSGIAPIRRLDTTGLRTHHGTEVQDPQLAAFGDPAEPHHFDRATQLAIAAAASALAEAGVGSGTVAPDRMGLCFGASGAGQFQDMQFTLDGVPLVSKRAALFHSRNVCSFHAEVLAKRFGVRGPVVAFAAASAGSALAIDHAMRLLRSGRADYILAGGAEGLTATGLIGMDSLDLCAADRCAPFGGRTGMSFGEGAAFLLLERTEQARGRGAVILGELLACAVRSDAYDSLANDPAGRGLTRALRTAIQRSGIKTSDVSWVKASGTGHRGHDQAEALALREVFGEQVPPATSFEPSWGHTNGASPAMGVAGALLCHHEGMIPPTASMVPCTCNGIDLVQSTPRVVTTPYHVCNSVAFGGLNAVIVGGRTGAHDMPIARRDDVVITGVGVISPVGCTLDSFASALRESRVGVSPVDRFDIQGCRTRNAAFVLDPVSATMGRPGVGRRSDGVSRYAHAAVSSALRDAGLSDNGTEARLGLVVALSRGPVAAQDRFFTRMAKDGGTTPAFGRALLEMASFSVASRLCAAFRARGYSATFHDGVGGGLRALVEAVDVLRHDEDHDAIVIVAADELSAMFFRLYDRLGVLSAGTDERPWPYHPAATGMVLGEGAVAFVLERGTMARARGARVRTTVGGIATSSDAMGFQRMDSSGLVLTRAIEHALADAGVKARGVDAIYGLGRGVPSYDERELRALARLFRGEPVPVSCVLGNTGVAEAASGLFGVVAALASFAHGEVFPIAGGEAPAGQLDLVRGRSRPARMRNILLAGSTESGGNAAIVLCGSQGEKP